MAGLTGLEPAASCVTGMRSNQTELQSHLFGFILRIYMLSLVSFSRLCCNPIYLFSFSLFLFLRYPLSPAVSADWAAIPYAVYASTIIFIRKKICKYLYINHKNMVIIYNVTVKSCRRFPSDEIMRGHVLDLL